jgi:hypothetical protein
VVLGVVVLAAVLGGCGGGSDSSSSLTKAEYVKQADAICAERKKEWTGATASYEKEAKEKKAESDPKLQKKLIEEVLTDTMLPALEKQLESLEDLGAPEGKEKQVEKMLASFSKQLDTIKTPTDLLETGFTEFEEEAEDLGVECPLL